MDNGRRTRDQWETIWTLSVIVPEDLMSADCRNLLTQWRCNGYFTPIRASMLIETLERSALVTDAEQPGLF